MLNELTGFYNLGTGVGTNVKQIVSIAESISSCKDATVLVDVEKEIDRLTKEQKRLEGEIKRCNGMLNNPKFVDKAPQAQVDEEKAKLEKYEGMLATVNERLAQLGK